MRALAVPALVLAATACAEVPLPAPDPAAPLAVSGACVLRDSPDPTDPTEPEPEPPRGRAEPETPGDTCAVADSNLARAEAAILVARARARPVAASGRPKWDHRSKPAGLDDVARRFALPPAELAALHRDGFVVSARLEVATYANAFHEIHQSELPLYVSADAILHAVFRGNDAIVRELEARRLEPLLGRALAILHCALPGAAAAYPEDAARDLDLHLTVARSLLADHAVTPVYPETGWRAALLVSAARAAHDVAEVDLYGRPRRIDWSAFAARGHYADDGRLAPYFRASAWLSRVEWNLVSRGGGSSTATSTVDPRETPREAVLALALADLVARSGVAPAIASLDRAWTVLGGTREDVSTAELTRLRVAAGIHALTEPRVYERLVEAIDAGHARTARAHATPDGRATRPVIATLLGARVPADVAATELLVAPRVPGRFLPGAAELVYALGLTRARAHLADEARRFPTLDAGLADARAMLHGPATPAPSDLHGLWLRAIVALGDEPSGVAPSFMSTDAFADMRLDSTLVALGQLRHASVLFAGQPYDQGGCVIPDAFVEPVPAVYAALAAYADAGAAALPSIDPGDVAHGRAYFERLARTLRVLEAIARGEIEGRALSEDERSFLSMVVEIAGGTTGAPATFTGWYFDMFPSATEALARADFVSDWFTSTEQATVAYVGARPPRIGVFVVDTGGSPRVVVGPVARGYERRGPLAARLTEETADKLADVPAAPGSGQLGALGDRLAVPASRAPALAMECDGQEATVVAAKPLGPVTVELLDHHRRVIDAVTRSADVGATKFTFRPVPEDRPVEAVHLHVGSWDAWTVMGANGSANIDTNPPELDGGS